MLNHENLEGVRKNLITIVNEELDYGFSLDENFITHLRFSLWDINKFSTIEKTFKFKTVGHVKDFPDIFVEKENKLVDYSYFNVSSDDVDKISISKKFNAIMFSSMNSYGVEIQIVISDDKYEKFNKNMIEIFSKGSASGIFNIISNKKLKKNEYIEVQIPMTVNEKKYDRTAIVHLCKLEKENLIFDKDSNIYNVMNDISRFFTKEAKKLYDKLDISYKRGCILYGEPGNGKTAMLREIIRRLPTEIIKVIMNSNIENFTAVLNELINFLNGKKALIIIEDIDSLLRKVNRSELLNVLDGVNTSSGIYMVGTTNYIEDIDPAFVNRSGRFDRSFYIENPNYNVRKAYFTDKGIGICLSGFKIHDDNSTDKNLTVNELFAKYSEGMSMSDLKELMISSEYMLISEPSLSVEGVVKKTSNLLKDVKSKHVNRFNSKHNNSQNLNYKVSKYNEDFDDDE